MRIGTARDALVTIADGATVAISGGGYRLAPEGLLAELERMNRMGLGPTALTVLAVAMVERGRAGRGGAGTGLNHFAAPGLATRIISGSYSRSRGTELNQAIDNGSVEAYNYPMGTMIQWLRASAAGRPFLLTQVGIGTYIDPRIDGGVFGGSSGPLNTVITVEDEEFLLYPALTVDVALVKASAADDRGNLYLHNDAFDHGIQDIAMAAHRAGGRVVAEVDRIIERGVVHPRMVAVPGALVDDVVLSDGAWEDEQDPILTGSGGPVVLSDPEPRTQPRQVIADIVVSMLDHHDMVNLGAGIPMYDVPEAARRLNRDDLYFTVEQGPMGGWPQVGGVSRLPEALWPQHDVFDFYEGGGPDVSILSFGQVGANGDVNVSSLAGIRPGCGGFPNIAHGAKRLIFCGTLTTGGLVETVDDGELRIVREGRIDRFIDSVDQITFSAATAAARGARIEFVTERAVLSLHSGRLHVTHVAPGVDLDRDVLAHLPTTATTVAAPALMPVAFFENPTPGRNKYGDASLETTALH